MGLGLGDARRYPQALRRNIRSGHNCPGKRWGDIHLQIEALAVAFLALRELLTLVAVGILLCSADDVLIDLFYVARLIRRRLTVYRRYPRATAQSLPHEGRTRIAILLPAWREASVIARMLTRALRTLNYPAYRIFVGIYPNDPATRAAVEGLADPRITIVVNPRPGGTTKGDNLNSLWRGLIDYECATGERFGAVVLHDAEDVVHADELAIFDHLLPRRDLVQLPVAPIPDRGLKWVSGTYADEFAEAHLKDLVIREALGAAIPSAGVACAIRREMLDRISAGKGGAPFDADCVTEDYEIGLRIHALGGRGCMVRLPASEIDRRVVSTREYFPDSFKDAVKQKSRWLLGIALQGWDRIGWQGGLVNRLMLLRDRKSIGAAIVTLLAYACLIACVLLQALRAVSPAVRALPPLAPQGRLLRPLLSLTTGFLGWRLLVRATCVWIVYDARQALLSIPRALGGNLINIAAALTALRRYVRISLRLETLRWDKTMHRFPEQPG